MMKGKLLMMFVLGGIFFMILGAYASEPLLRAIDRVLFIVGVFPWQYWLVIGIILAFLRLWWSERWMRLCSETIRPHWKRISQMSTGWGFWAISNWWIDNPVYLWVIAYKGLVTGGIIMTVFATFWNSLYVIFHEYHKRKGVDWLGLDGIDSMRESLERRLSRWKSSRSHIITKAFLFIPKNFVKLLVWMLGKGDGFAFVALTFWTDSFVTLAYVRRGRSGTITGKDWGLFLLSTVMSNVYWSIRSYGIVAIILYFLNTVT